MQWLNSILGQETNASNNTRGGGFQVGDIVEYDSASQGAWILARVLALRDDGLVDLDCKAGVPLSKIRKATAGAGTAAQPASQPGTIAGGAQGAQGQYAPGTIVEYNSASQGWILARVLGFDAATSTYNLDCKQQVPAAKIRLAPQDNRASSSTFAPASRKDDVGAGNTLPPAQQQQPQAAGVIQPPSYSQPPPSRHDLPPPAQSMGRLPPGSSTFTPAAGAVAQDAPMQLVSVSREGEKWRFKVNEDAARILESYGQRRVAVATICGPYRTGKSYLLNLLLGRIQRGEKIFSVGSTTQACTQGLWMWGSTAGPEGSTMVYLDCEGFGSTDSDRTRDCKLMSLCIILSSIFVLNTKGVLNEGLFNALSLVVSLAEHMEERGQETSKPALIWCLRDFILQLEDEAGQPISPDQYLEKALQAKPTGVDAERSRAAREVRETLLRFFPQRNCVTFVQPTIDEEKLRSLATAPYSDLRPEFKKQLESLQEKLHKDAASRPKTVAGQVVGGAALAALLRKLVEALNSNKALNVMTAWEQVQHTACGSLLEDLRHKGMERLQALARGAEPLPVQGSPTLPVRDDVLAKALAAVRAELYEEWKSRAVGEENTRGEYWEELIDSLHGEELAVERKNIQMAEDQLREALQAWEAFLSAEGGDGSPSSNDPRAEMLASLLDRGMPAEPASRVANEALNAAKLARLKWDAWLSAAKADQQKAAGNNAASPAPGAAASLRTDEKHLEDVRKMGQLEGQVAELQQQLKDATTRAQKTAERIPEVEEALRLEQIQTKEAREEAIKKAKEVNELKEQIKELEAEPHKEDGGGKQKCCSLM